VRQVFRWNCLGINANRLISETFSRIAGEGDAVAKTGCEENSKNNKTMFFYIDPSRAFHAMKNAPDVGKFIRKSCLMRRCFTKKIWITI